MIVFILLKYSQCHWKQWNYMAKSIADKIDLGAIMLEVSNEDLIALEETLARGGYERPTVKISIYKNRRGRHKDILLWCVAERGTCKITPIFATTYQYEMVEIKKLKINVNRQE